MTSIDSTFNVPPFPAFPSVTRYVPIGSLDEALLRVGRSLDAREAISLIIGPPGTGKSLACQMLTKRFSETHDVVVLGDTPIEDRSALLRHLLHHLGADHVAGPANDLQLALVDRVSASDTRGLLVLVDEAQSLSADVLEAIRMTTNIMKNGEPRVSAVICGGPKLDEILVSPTMEAFTQRVATRCYLHPMSGDETSQYVSHIIAACGADPASTISSDALSAIHHGCNGVPRLINQLMTQAIDVAEDHDQALIDEKIVDQAWAMLQQLPSPMIEEPKIGPSKTSHDTQPSVIEFGELSVLSSTSTSGESSAAISDQPTAESLIAETELDAAIEIESSDAEWIDENAPETANHQDDGPSSIKLLTPNNSDLFGRFDNEEELSIGATDVAGRQDMNAQPSEVLGCCAGNPPIEDSKFSEVDCPNTHNLNLESMLHQEIIGLSAMDDSVAIIPDHDHESAPGASTSPLELPRSDSKNSTMDPPLELVEDETITVMDHGDNGDSVNQAAIRFVEDSNQRPLTEPFRNGPSCDDSDLLVIEDELELRIADERDRQTISISAAENTQAQAVDVDFQAMLTKMRTGS